MKLKMKKKDAFSLLKLLRCRKEWNIANYILLLKKN